MLRLAQVGLAGALLAAGCQRESRVAGKAETAVEQVAVTVVAAKAAVRPAVEEVPGLVRARLRAGLEAKVSARIEAMLVAPGEAVKAGQTLARLETREIQARLDQMLPVLKNSEAEAERFKTLFEKNAVSKSEYEGWEARLRVARAAVTEAETLLGQTTIMAPFEGVITRKFADVGDLAQPGRVILEMEDPKTLRVEVDIPESLIGGIEMGAACSVTGPNGENRTVGTVGEIAPAADAGTRTFLVKLDLPPTARLKSGQFARVSAPAGERRALLLPAAAVATRGQLELAFVAEKGVAKLRLVRTGKRLGDEVEVVAGITEGESVIAKNVAGLKDGSPIKLAP